MFVLLAIGLAMLAGAVALCGTGFSNRGTVLLLCFALFVGASGFFWIVLPPLLAAVGVVAVVTMISHTVGQAVPSYRRIALGAIGLVLAFSVADGLREIAVKQRLRSEFPFESLEARLSPLETQSESVSTTPAAMDSENAAPSGSVTDDPTTTRMPFRNQSGFWERFETDMDRRHRWRAPRRQSLAAIHASAVNAFVDSPGFGVFRLQTTSRADESALTLRAPLPELLPLRDPSPDIDTSGTPDGGTPRGTGLEVLDRSLLRADASVARDLAPGSAVDPSDLASTHLASVKDVFDTERFGLVRGTDRTAGFLSHRFTRVPKVGGDELEGERTRSDYALARLELVSLLRHPEPRAYVSESLPRMDALDAVATRDLDPFEARALKALRAGHDVQSQTEGTELRMLGSLRAVQVCRDCHKVEAGTLLGAFSYRFRHVPSKTGDPAPIGVGRADWVRPPLPPNRTCGSPASGSPVDRSPS